MDQEIQIVRECILPHYAAQQKEDIIQELSKRMKERNLVNADFQEAVLKRVADRKTQYRYTTYGAAVCKSTVYRYRHLEKKCCVSPHGCM